METGNGLVSIDIYRQHLAYEHGGIETMRSFAADGQLSPRLLSAWEDVDVLRGVEDPSATVERLLSGWRDREPLTTMSAGFATHASGRSPQETVAAADRALYEAKAGGRDRVVAA